MGTSSNGVAPAELLGLKWINHADVFKGMQKLREMVSCLDLPSIMLTQ